MKRIKEFSIGNYIPEHDRLNGVHFEDQKAIVTDGHYLVAVENPYPECMERVTLYKDFSLWDSEKKYPNWVRVIPDISSGYHCFDMKAEDLTLCYKLKGSSICFKNYEYNLGYLSPYVLDVMIEFMNNFRSSRIYIPDNISNAWKIVTNNVNTFMLLMPRVREDFVPYVYDINSHSLTIQQ